MRRGKVLGWGGAAACLGALIWVPGVLAAPVNDHFADREPLEGALPIEAVGTNVGATKEEGEPVLGFAPAGHSVWFEWEAESTGWITIGACESGFPTILAIFTGGELDKLTQVAGGNADEGPDCPYSQRQYTFKAVSGTNYVIAVDGDSFYLPPAEPPPGEGEFALRVEPTPPPANDFFAQAAGFTGEITEEPGGARFYFARTYGYNWGATTEVDEPFYGTDSGASVWFSWTPPETDRYRISGPCCGLGLNFGLFQGSSIGGLNQVLAATGFAEVDVVAGTTYWIGVWGTPDLETAEPTMASFSIGVSAVLPPRDEGGEDFSRENDPITVSPPFPQVQVDTTPPSTRVFKRARRGRPPFWVFHFRSSEPGSTFRCKLDRSRWRRCRSPLRIRRMRRGRHALRVAAVDAAGNRDLSPAVTRFAFKRRKHRTHRRSR